jgi:hypothetical protein
MIGKMKNIKFELFELLRKREKNVSLKTRIWLIWKLPKKQQEFELYNHNNCISQQDGVRM